MRQGNDVGTQYRSGIYTFDAEQARPPRPRASAYAGRLAEAGYGEITTEIVPRPSSTTPRTTTSSTWRKVPNGYCGLGGTGVSCPVGLTSAS